MTPSRAIAPPLWSKEDDALLTSYWAKGLSAGRIMAFFPGRTRNAVIGRISRLGLPKRQTSSKAIKERSKAICGVIKPTRIKAPTKPVKVALQPPSLPILRPLENAMKTAIAEQEPPVWVEGIAHDDLTPSVCQWPLNDRSPWRFCGGPREDGKPYCGRHCISAYSGVYRPGIRPARPERAMREEESEAA